MSKPTLLTPGNVVENDRTIDEIPIHYIIDRIRQKCKEPFKSFKNRILLIKAKTGSGKSTILPSFLYNDMSASNKTIICTQPRVLNTISIPTDVAKRYPEFIMGRNIGYLTRNFKNAPRQGLIYMTLGILTQQLLHMNTLEFINKYSAIIVDEAHDRSIEFDYTVSKLKSIMNTCIDNDFPIVVFASATLDIENLTNYYSLDDTNTILVSGRQFNIDIHWLKDETHDYYTNILSTLDIITTKDDEPNYGDVLVFLPGLEEIIKTESLINSASDRYRSLVIRLDRENILNESSDYKSIRKDLSSLKIKTSKGQITPLRKIILATVVAETGITIASLKYVIDAGWSRDLEMYYPQNYIGLITKPVSKAQMQQRMGRVGRLFPGVFYPMYTEETYKKLSNQQIPKIITNGVSSVILQLIDDVEEFDITKLDLLDPPGLHSIKSTLNMCSVYNFIDNDYKLTDAGKQAKDWNIFNLSEYKLIQCASFWGVSILDMCTIIAATQIRVRNLGDLRTATDKYKAVFIYPSWFNSYDEFTQFVADDFIELIFLIDSFSQQVESTVKNMDTLKTKDDIVDVLEQTGIKYNNMCQLITIREGIIDYLLSLGVSVFIENSDIKTAKEKDFLTVLHKYKRCFYETYYMNLLTKVEAKYGGYKQYETSTYKTLYGDNIRVNNCTNKYYITPSLRISNMRDKKTFKLSPTFMITLDDMIKPDLFKIKPYNVSIKTGGSNATIMCINPTMRNKLIEIIPENLVDKFINPKTRNIVIQYIKNNKPFKSEFEKQITFPEQIKNIFDLQTSIHLENSCCNITMKGKSKCLCSPLGRYMSQNETVVSKTADLIIITCNSELLNSFCSNYTYKGDKTLLFIDYSDEDEDYCNILHYIKGITLCKPNDVIYKKKILNIEFKLLKNFKTKMYNYTLYKI